MGVEHLQSSSEDNSLSSSDLYASSFFRIHLLALAICSVATFGALVTQDAFYGITRVTSEETSSIQSKPLGTLANELFYATRVLNVDGSNAYYFACSPSLSYDSIYSVLNHGSVNLSWYAQR